MKLPVIVTTSSEFTLPPGEWLNVFLVGGGGCGAGDGGGGGGSGHLVEAEVQVPTSGKLAVTIGSGSKTMYYNWLDGNIPGGETTVECEGAPIIAAGGKPGTAYWGGAGWSGGGGWNSAGGWNGGAGGGAGGRGKTENILAFPRLRPRAGRAGKWSCGRVGGGGGGGVVLRGWSIPAGWTHQSGEGFGAGGGGGITERNGNDGCVVIFK